MKARRLVVVSTVALVSLVAVLVAFAATRAAAPPFTPGQQTANAADDWANPNGDIFNQRHSALKQITTANVKGLKVAWTTQLVVPGLKAALGPLGVFAEASPVVYQGVMYMPDSNNNVWAIDSNSGERLWIHRPKTPKGFTALIPSRGVSIGDGRVFFANADATISALDQDTGRVLWKKKVADYKGGYYFTNAPVYYNGAVLTGTSGGDSGSRGFVVSLNAKTGAENWRFYVIPEKPGEPGYNTWPRKRAFLGGGAMWNPVTVDPGTSLLYVAVGNPIPYSGIIRGAGDELFTDSIVAINVKTGKYRWHFQTTHHDIWDYDATNAPILFNLRYNGKMRRGIAHAGKTGWVYILDRTNGKPLVPIIERKVKQLRSVNTAATQPYPVGDSFSQQCAKDRLYKGKKAPDGKPYKVGCIYTPYDDKQFVAFAPSALGGANWPPSAYSPDTGYIYICSKDSAGTFKAVPAKLQKLKPLGDFAQVEGLIPGKGVNQKTTGRIVAMNLRNNRIVWQKTWSTLCYSGMLSTAGNLVFVGRNEGFLEAYNAKTGSRVWRSPKLKAGVNAPAVTYMQDGKQYVTVFAGGNGLASIFGGIKPFYGATLYTFALPS